MSENCDSSLDDVYISILHGRELKRIIYQFKSPQIEWRPHFVRYILDICGSYCLSPTTSHLAVYLFDIFLDNHDIDLQRLRLVSTTCVRLAAKLEEGTFLVPCMDNFNIGVKSFAIEYPRKETILMEMMVLSIFDFNINIPTVATFCLYFLEYGVDENEFQENRLQHSSFKEMKKSVKATTMALLENSLFDIGLQQKCLPSKLAAGCLAGSRYVNGFKQTWSIDLNRLTGYTWTDLKEFVDKLLCLKIPSTIQLRNELLQKFIVVKDNNDNTVNTNSNDLNTIQTHQFDIEHT